MKHKLLYIFLISCFFLQESRAQFDCVQTLEVTLDENGEGSFLASDLLPNVDFYVATGTVTYYIVPFFSGVINSGNDIITVDCSAIWSGQYLIEYTEDGGLIDGCNGKLTFTDPLDGCPNFVFCEDSQDDCHKAVGAYSYYSQQGSTFTIEAEDIARCGDVENCTGTYGIAIGNIADAETLTYTSSLSSDEITEYLTPIVLSYTDGGITKYDNTNLYVWQNLECFLFSKGSVTVELDLTAEATLVPEMFLRDENTCMDVQLALTPLNSNLPPDVFFDSVVLDCDDIGYSQVYLKDELTGMITKSQLFLADPLEVCGPILGPGDKLISMSNDPPLGTYANSKISLNGEILPVSSAGRGWVINEDQLTEGTNTLDFDSGPFNLNGVSTLDLVRLLYLIIYDEYNDPIQSVVMDIDGSGYNGIGDLILIRSFILGIPIQEDIKNALFISNEFEFPNDFDPFNFEYDFSKYEFENTDYESESFLFNAYKIGDFNGTAVLEEGLISDMEASTRSVGVFEVSDMEVTAGVPFEFTFSYDSGTPFKGLLAALVSNGIMFESLTSDQGAEVQYNIIDEKEIRISYVSSNPLESIDNISFQISANSSLSGSLIDLLGLKPGFPNEVIDIQNEVINIEDIEEETITSVTELTDKMEVTIFPNPAYQYLQLNIPAGEIGIVDLMDVHGQKVMRANSADNKLQIDISNLASGVYFLDFVNPAIESKRVFTKM